MCWVSLVTRNGLAFIIHIITLWALYNGMEYSETLRFGCSGLGPRARGQKGASLGRAWQGHNLYKSGRAGNGWQQVGPVTSKCNW